MSRLALAADVPGWDWTPITDVTDTITDYVSNGSFASLRENVTYRRDPDHAILLRVADHSSDFKGPFVYVDEHAYNFLEKSRLYPGDIVVGNVGSIGTAFEVPTLDRPLTIGPNALLVRPSDKNRFLYYLILSPPFQDHLQSISSKIAQPKFNKTQFRNIEVPWPPSVEQQRIAQVLSTVQEAIAQQERLIRTTTELKQALMQKLFTEGLRGEALKETEIGRVPESWEVVKVMDAGTVVTGSTPSTSREDFYGGNYNLISPGDLDVTKYVNTVQKKLTALGFDQCRKLPKGAVLVGCIGNVGKVGIVADDRSATNQQINAIIPNERYDGEFLYYAMDYNRKRLEALAGKVTIPLVNKSNFERFQIAAPPINYQRLIAEALDAVDARKAVAEKKRNALQDLFRTLLHELMTGKVRVGDLDLVS